MCSAAALLVPVLLLAGCPKPTPSNPTNAGTPTQSFPSSTGKVADDTLKATGTRSLELKIASYNINFGNPHLSAVVDSIRKVDPDVVCLEETTRESEALLTRTFGNDYPHIRFQGHRGEYGAERFGILSRLPVNSYEFVAPEHGLFGFFIADAQFNSRPIRIIAVHLQPILFPNDPGVRDVLSAIGAVEKMHRAEIDAVVEHVKKDVPTIVAGDFNSIATFQAPQKLVESGFLDSFAEVNENPESLPTWHWPTRNGEISLRIDYIFHSKDFRATEINVIKSEASDHYLIFSRLKWRG